MGIAYCCDKTTGLCVSVWDGEVSAEQRELHMAALESDADWGAGGLVLSDLTGVSAARPSAVRVLEIANDFSATLAPKVRDAKWAIVAGETFGFAQQFGSYLEEEVLRLIVFNDLATACSWLGVDVADVRTTLDELRADPRSGTMSA